MHRIQLSRSPYSDLFCPFCGVQWTSEEAENIDECEHLIYAGMEEDPEEAADLKLEATDICFELFEPAPASRSHYFVVRE